MTSSYKSESGNFSFTVEKSHNKTVIDLNFGGHKDLTTLKRLNITFLSRKIREVIIDITMRL